jgi:hypothetical protein
VLVDGGWPARAWLADMKPTEVRMVAELLLGEAEDAEDLAARIIVALGEARAGREQWVAVAQVLGFVIASGPWPTKLQAEKDLKKLGPGGAVCRLRPTLEVS